MGDGAAEGGAETAKEPENDESKTHDPAAEMAEQARASQNASRMSAAHSERIVE